MSIGELLSKHRTKVLGLTQTAAGALVAQLPQYPALLSPKHAGYVMIGLGVSTSILGFINTQIINTQISQGASNALDAAGVPPVTANAAMAATGTTPVPPT